MCLWVLPSGSLMTPALILLFRKSRSRERRASDESGSAGFGEVKEEEEEVRRKMLNLSPYATTDVMPKVLRKLRRDKVRDFIHSLEC